MPTVLLSGASGFIGSRLTDSLRADGHVVVPLTRRAGVRDAVLWDAATGKIDTRKLARVQPEIVINLATDNIAQRCTPQTRRLIRYSRVIGTRAL